MPSNEKEPLEIEYRELIALGKTLFQGTLKAVPYIGPALEHFIFGPLQELRWKRIETTLAEIANSLHDRCIPASAVANEPFVNLFESCIKQISRSTEEKRQAFRNLLLNAALTDPSAQEPWEEARLAGGLIESIEAPGLSVLAGLAQNMDKPINIVSKPACQLIEIFERTVFYTIPYEWAVVEEWVYRLRDWRLISFTSVDANGGFGNLDLTPLGKLLVSWAVATEDRTRG